MPQAAHGDMADQLRELLAEATRALVNLDADRLEELALCCQALNRNLPEAAWSAPHNGKDRMRAQRTANRELESFGRVLEVTRGNLGVMREIRGMERALLEYPHPAVRAWRKEDARDGDN